MTNRTSSPALSSVGMAEKPDQAAPKDEGPVAIPLDPETALRALLKVDPEADSAARQETPPHPPGASTS